MRRLWRWLKRIVLALLALAALVFIGNALINWRNDAKLEQRVAALKAAGAPVSFADFPSRTERLEDNAAIYLRRAHDDLEAVQQELMYLPTASDESLDHGTPDATALKAVREAFDAYPKLIPLLEQAAACPDYVLQIDASLSTDARFTELLSRCQDNRSAVRILRYRVLQLLADGDRERASHLCPTMFRLARHFDRTPMMVGHLVAIATRGMAENATTRVLLAGPLPPAIYEALEAELAREDQAQVHRWNLATERVSGLQAFQEQTAMFGSAFFRPNWHSYEVLSYLDLIDAVIAMPIDSDSLMEDPNIRQIVNGSGPLTRLLIPSLEAYRRALLRSVASTRSLRVLNALCARQANGDGADTAITDLGLPKEVTIDPFNGDPLHVKKLIQGWVVYSVGVNLKDDDGAVNSDNLLDVGVGPVMGLPPFEKRAPSSDEQAPSEQ